ncbi:Sec-independent protein translocase protein TatB [Marinobacter nanhaiticus D15-8W]|uniref:Sec-independent protein translocase protein TatB n=1 Tax=Marinobacter nanhaiticus TaxID=1305740 RepID=UPI0029240FD2|nr:Sec-independent protein translocase protein TatB [Marinobacter nanhaiticus D15-8W]
MFDIGFLELLICGVIALLVLGPERLPGAARTAERWIGRSRRLVSQFTTELDRQIKAEELKEKLRKEGGIDLEGVQRNIREGLDQARKYEHLVVDDNESRTSAKTSSSHQETPKQAGIVPPMRSADAAREPELPSEPDQRPKLDSDAEPTRSEPEKPVPEDRK